MTTGWIKLHRKLRSAKVWTTHEPFTRGQAWVDLLLAANFEDRTMFVRGVAVKVRRGQIGESVVTLAQKWKRSRGWVSRFLKWLETVQQIEQQKNNVTTIITILNYDSYQQADQQMEQQTGSKRAADGQQTDTTKKEKKVKKYKNSAGGVGSNGQMKGDIDDVIGHYQRHHRRAKPGESERRKIRDRLKEGYSVDDLKQAIDGCHSSPYHCGDNAGNTKYQSLELIVRDSKHVQMFVEHAGKAAKVDGCRKCGKPFNGPAIDGDTCMTCAGH